MRKERRTIQFVQICPICGRKFPTNKFSFKFCSIRCKELGFRLDFEKKKHLLKICTSCHSIFLASQGKQRFCSVACRKDGIYPRDLEKKGKDYHPKPTSKLCENCGSEFFPYRSFQKYCSYSCKQKKSRQEEKKKSTKIGLMISRNKPPLYWQILNRDNFRCQYCGRTPTEDGIKLQIDHIKPKSDGGKAEFDNLVSTCNHCNLSKSDRPLRHEAKFKKRIQKVQLQAPQTSFDFLLRST